MLTEKTPATVPRRAVVLGGVGIVLASAGRTGAANAADDAAEGGDRLVEIRNLARQTERALEAGNVGLLDSYLAEDYVCIDLAGNALDKRGRLKQLKEAGLQLSRVESEKQTVSLYDQTVIVTGLLNVKGSMSGRDIGGRYRYLDVWIRRDDKWKAIASTMTRVADVAPEAGPRPAAAR